jgi:cytochrome c
MQKSIRFLAAASLVAATALGALNAGAAERVTAKEAEAMVKKGVAYIKANPRDKAMADITSKTGQFVDRELYLTVYSMDGTALAHGANEKFVGKNMIDLRDGNGKEHIKERMDLAKVKPAFWHDFSFVNPVTRKIEPKSMYCERASELVVCGGIYKPA